MKQKIYSSNININSNSELYNLIIKLFNCWSDWEKYKTIYLTKLIPKLKNSLADTNDNEKILIQKIKEISTEEEWENLELIAKFVYKNEKYIKQKNKCISLFCEALKNNQFEDCYDYIELNTLFNREDKEKLFLELNKKIEEYIANLKNSLDSSKDKLLNKDFIKTFYNNLENLPESKQNEIKKYLNKKIKSAEFVSYLKDTFELYNFKEADNLFLRENIELQTHEYEELKAEYIQKWFNEKQNIIINQEQSRAIAKNTQNTLVTARAGSGKTRTIACRAIYAIEKENIKPEEIMLLTFNKKAAEEIGQKIYEGFNYKNFNKYTIRTFHSLAWAIIIPQEEPIWDDKDTNVKQKLTLFIQNLYKSKNLWNMEFKNRLYDLYRSDESEINQKFILQDLSKEERYLFLRSKKLVTLDGKKVNSNGEKWIADFLFEHNIEYAYNKILTHSKTKLYRPDFTLYLNNKNYIIEHWGIDENDLLKQVAKNFRKSWDDYYEEMQWKRNTCKLKGVILIETSILDMKSGRNAFEKLLKEKLENAGIICKKLSKEEILNKIEIIHKDKIAKRFGNFIQYAQKTNASYEKLKEKLNKINFSPKNKMFLELAIDLYSEYKNELKKQNKTDFDNILVDAIYKIKQTKGECEILIGKQIVKIKDIKFLLIDEFQDFSRLFYNLINAIKKYNKNIKLFCVGDDWQAINSFAGSDLKYFKEYNSLYQNSNNATLLYNYRSTKNIVETGNKIMYGQGKPAIAFNSENGPDLKINYIDDIDYKNNDGKIDTKFIYDNEENYFNLQHRYLKQCYEIIKKEIKINQNKSFIIMHRQNKLCNYKDLSSFKNALIDRLTEYIFSIAKIEPHKNLDSLKYKIKKELDINIQCGTIHQFKGAEADVAIIMECSKDNFPLIHPDSEIDLIFDRSSKIILDEELHLFYVAVTRAKQQVYFICEKDNKSSFLSNIV